MSLNLTKLGMVILYWIIIVPTGLVRRLLGIRDIDFRWHDGSITYWHQHQDKSTAKHRYNNQF